MSEASEGFFDRMAADPEGAAGFPEHWAAGFFEMELIDEEQHSAWLRARLMQGVGDAGEVVERKRL